MRELKGKKLSKMQLKYEIHNCVKNRENSSTSAKKTSCIMYKIVPIKYHIIICMSSLWNVDSTFSNHATEPITDVYCTIIHRPSFGLLSSIHKSWQHYEPSMNFRPIHPKHVYNLEKVFGNIGMGMLESLDFVFQFLVWSVRQTSWGEFQGPRGGPGRRPRGPGRESS